MARQDGQKSEFKFTNLRIEIQKIAANNSFFVIVCRLRRCKKIAVGHFGGAVATVKQLCH